MLPWWAWAIAACWRSKAALLAENLCLRQQLLVLRRRQLRPRLSDRDRRFWILASRWFPGWQDILVVVNAPRCYAGTIAVGGLIGAGGRDAEQWRVATLLRRSYRP
jgi:hypothetical protein